MSVTDLAHDDDDDDDDDDDVHVFDPMGDGPLLLLILLVFMVIVCLILFIWFYKGFPWGTNRDESPLKAKLQSHHEPMR